MSLGSGAFEGSFSFASRFESGEGTNPEELIAAAHAGCFSMHGKWRSHALLVRLPTGSARPCRGPL
jgi:organic hydroperoxide reductase OsmC/OhrA